MSSWDYPAGAEFDKNAPFNEPDFDWAYEKAEDIIKDEMCFDCDKFIEWLFDNKYLPEDCDLREPGSKELVESLAENEDIAESYYEYRKEDVVQDILEEAANEPDYDTRDEYRDYWLENEPD